MREGYTLKSGYIPEYTVEIADGSITPEQYFEVLTNFEILLEKKYPHIKVTSTNDSVFKPLDAGI